MQEQCLVRACIQPILRHGADPAIFNFEYCSLPVMRDCSATPSLCLSRSPSSITMISVVSLAMIFVGELPGVTLRVTLVYSCSRDLDRGLNDGVAIHFTGQLGCLSYPRPSTVGSVEGDEMPQSGEAARGGTICIPATDLVCE